MYPKITSELYRQAYFESSVAIKTTRIQDEDCLLVQGALTGTLWDKTIKCFLYYSLGFVPVGLQSPLHSPKLMDLRRPVAAGWLAATPGWENRDCAHHSHRCPQLPPTMLRQRSQLKIMKIWRGRGEAGREWRPCSYFLIMKLLTFNSLTPENPFVNCFNKSKTWYKTEDSRLFFWGAFPFSFPATSLRTGLILWKQLSSFNFKARACYHNTNMLMSLCYPPPRWMNELLWERWQVTLPWGKCPSVLPVSQSRTEAYQVLAAGYTDCHVEHCWELRRFGQAAYRHREYQFHSNSFLPHRCTSFRQKLKSSEWTLTTHFEWGNKTSILVEREHTINKAGFCTKKLVWLFTVAGICPLTKDTLLICPCIKKWVPGGWLRGIKVKRKIWLQLIGASNKSKRCQKLTCVTILLSPLTKTALKSRPQQKEATVSKGECLKLCLYSYFHALLTGWPDFEKV